MLSELRGAVICAFRLAGQPAGMATGVVFATLSVTVANLVCLRAPLIIAHFISNLSFGLVPLFFVLRGA